jgi:hypothetical protein
VGLIIEKNKKELTLNSVSSFASRTVILQIGIDINYICSYFNNNYSVLNITSSKSFKIEWDILKCGDTFLETLINC